MLVFFRWDQPPSSSGAVFDDLLLRIARAGQPAGNHPGLCGFPGVSHGGADFSCWATRSQRTANAPSHAQDAHLDHFGQPQIFILGGWGGGVGIPQMPHFVYSGAG